MRGLLIVILGMGVTACESAAEFEDRTRFQARFLCDEVPQPGPSACMRGPLSRVLLADPRGCVPFAASRETTPARRASVETLCRDNVLDTDGRVLVTKARLADRIDAAESTRRVSGDPARQAQAAADLAILRELMAIAPAE
ncbi:MAG: hypothetical protein JNJ97_04980 [Alphaproteobacteria bacterium]|nr:hypothetical protein [Alphaproteobacteria bacterium]